MSQGLPRKLWTGLMFLVGSQGGTVAADVPSFLTLKAVSIDGQSVEMKSFEGKVILVVNVASRCGFTSQYEGLEKLYNKYKDKGLVVLGFPSNDFGGQEPGTNSEIKSFCKTTYGVTFPMFAKGPVTGKDIQPVFKTLTASGGGVLWNFEKFLIDRRGRLRERYRSSHHLAQRVSPDKLRSCSTSSPSPCRYAECIVRLSNYRKNNDGFDRIPAATIYRGLHSNDSNQ